MEKLTKFTDSAIDFAISIKVSAFTIIALIGTTLSSLIGGWDSILQRLCILMLVDIAMGLIISGVLHKSPKTETGRISSNSGWKGLCKKGTTLLMVLVAAQVELISNTSGIRDGAILSYIIIELVSIIENAGIMGIPIPSFLTNAIDILKKKEKIEVISPKEVN